MHTQRLTALLPRTTSHDLLYRSGTGADRATQGATGARRAILLLGYMICYSIQVGAPGYTRSHRCKQLQLSTPHDVNTNGASWAPRTTRYSRRASWVWHTSGAPAAAAALAAAVLCLARCSASSGDGRHGRTRGERMASERWRAGRSPHGTDLIFTASRISLPGSRRWPDTSSSLTCASHANRTWWR